MADAEESYLELRNRLEEDADDADKPYAHKFSYLPVLWAQTAAARLVLEGLYFNVSEGVDSRRRCTEVGCLITHEILEHMTKEITRVYAESSWHFMLGYRQDSFAAYACWHLNNTIHKFVSEKLIYDPQIILQIVQAFVPNERVSEYFPRVRAHRVGAQETHEILNQSKTSGKAYTGRIAHSVVPAQLRNVMWCDEFFFPANRGLLDLVKVVSVTAQAHGAQCSHFLTRRYKFMLHFDLKDGGLSSLLYLDFQLNFGTTPWRNFVVSSLVSTLTDDCLNMWEKEQGRANIKTIVKKCLAANPEFSQLAKKGHSFEQPFAKYFFRVLSNVKAVEKAIMDKNIEKYLSTKQEEDADRKSFDFLDDEDDTDWLFLDARD